MSSGHDPRDVEQAFIEFLAELGIPPAGNARLVFDGQKRRFRTTRDKNSDENIEYKIHMDEHPAGYVKDYKTDSYHIWSYQKSNATPWTPEERKKYFEEQEAKRRSRQREEERAQAAAITRAAQRWDMATEGAVHPYLEKKKLAGAHGARILGKDLLIPSYNPDGKLVSVQEIHPDGTKRFQAGAPKRGCFYTIDGAGHEVFVCEGFATGASIREATGRTVIVAWDKGNLKPVIENVRGRYPGRLILAPDVDKGTAGNPGMAAAFELSEEFGIPFAYPPFSGGEKGSDWNDYMCIHGAEATAEAIFRQVKEWRDAPKHQPDTLPATAGSQFLDEFIPGELPEGGIPDEPAPIGEEYIAMMDGKADELPISAGYSQNDNGNAQRLYESSGDVMRSCPLWSSWLIWDNNRWEKDADHKALIYARQVSTMLYSHAEILRKSEEAASTKGKHGISLAKWARQSGNNGRIQAMLALLTSYPGITVKPEHFDSNPYLLNCRNGTLNLKNGRLYPHKKEDHITKLIDVYYDENADCPRWLNFLDKTFGVESEIIPYLQRVLGYSLTSDTSEQCFFIFHGEGQNGKSVLLETVKYVLGEYAKKAAPDTFMEKRNDTSAGYELAALDGARFVISDETEENKKLGEGIIKRVTGGDTISCRHMRENFYEYMPTYKVFIATNHQPVIKGSDKGIWRRIHMIPFNNQIEDSEKDPYLKEKLKEEAPGILAWLVRGCLNWQEFKGLRPPREILDAIEEYKGEQDIFRDFFDEHCIVEPDTYIEKNLLHNAFTRWCKENEQNPLSLAIFTRKMKSRGFPISRTTDKNRKTVKKFIGINLSPEGWAQSPQGQLF